MSIQNISDFISMIPKASSFAKDVDTILWIIFVVSLFYFVGFVLTMLYLVMKYRKRPQDTGEGEPINEKKVARIVIPVFAISIVLMLVLEDYIGNKLYAKLRDIPKRDDIIEIKVTARQWLWQFDYRIDGLQKTTINELVIPKNKVIKLVMRSDDVIHSFFVPAFRTKYDILPGKYTHLWFEPVATGTFDIFCAEFCGDGHSRMLGKVKVIEQGEFNHWLKGEVVAQVSTPGSEVVTKEGGLGTAELGARLIKERGCIACHSTDGTQLIGPTFRGCFGRKEILQDGTEITVDENYIKESIIEPSAKVVKGFSPVMPSFKGLLSDQEIDAVIDYLKTLK
jgi:cytochrome c oxidase subunit 2